MKSACAAPSSGLAKRVALSLCLPAIHTKAPWRHRHAVSNQVQGAGLHR